MLCPQISGALVQDKYHASYDFFHECVEKGIALTPEPFFIINERTDYLEGELSSTPFDSYICIPVLPKRAPEDAVHFPACTALSLLCYGNYDNDNINEAYLYFGEQIRKRRLTPAGFIRAIALVAPYVGREIDPNKYCSQLVLPVEEV